MSYQNLLEFAFVVSNLEKDGFLVSLGHSSMMFMPLIAALKFGWDFLVDWLWLWFLCFFGFFVFFKSELTIK